MYKNWRPLSVFLALMVLMVPMTALAATQAFRTTTSGVRSGMLVSLTRNPAVVEPSTKQTDMSLVGVVKDAAEDQFIEDGQVAVQTDGTANVLVSTLDGDIKVGDRIGPSSVVGFGSRLAEKGWMIGTAQAALAANTTGAVKTSLLDSAGAKHDVYVASVPVQVKVTYYASSDQTSKKETPIPDKVQDVANTLAGKRASVLAIVLSFFLILSGLTLAGIIAVTTIRSGIRAIARQPLVRQTVGWRMVQAFVVAVAIIISVNVGALVLLRIF